MAQKTVKVCPRCAGINSGMPNQGYGLFNMELSCRDCMFIGVFPEVDIDKLEDFKKRIRQDTEK